MYVGVIAVNGGWLTGQDGWRRCPWSCDRSAAKTCPRSVIGQHLKITKGA